MKLNYFKFQDGKIFWLPEYPEEPGYPCLDCTKMDCDAARCTEKYEDAIAESLASAIEVAPEDEEKIFKLLWWQDDMKPESTEDFQLEKGKVYSAECEMEIIYQYRNNDTKTGHSWLECSEQSYQSKQRPYEFRQVARLKPKEGPEKSKHNSPFSAHLENEKLLSKPKDERKPSRESSSSLSETEARYLHKIIELIDYVDGDLVQMFAMIQAIRALAEEGLHGIEEKTKQ